MVQEKGALQTAKDLVRASKSSYSEGLTNLWECERLDLSIEAKVLEERWPELCDDEERESRCSAAAPPAPHGCCRGFSRFLARATDGKEREADLALWRLSREENTGGESTKRKKRLFETEKWKTKWRE